jgi:hypothetical protein
MKAKDESVNLRPLWPVSDRATAGGAGVATAYRWTAGSQVRQAICARPALPA